MLILAVAAGGLLCAQDGQQSSRPGWPCVAGRAVDPSYIDVSESSGGQLFLFQKGEIEHAAPVMSASFTHPVTVLRAVGHLGGSRDFEFPVDSGMETILVLASLQCRSGIQVLRPGGSELTAANSALSIDLKNGRIHRIDNPEGGVWKVRLSGTGLFVLSVLTKADISLGSVEYTKGSVEARVSGKISNARFQMLNPGGDPIAELDAGESADGGLYQMAVATPGQRFRIRVTGTAASGWPFQRTYPVLFQVKPLQ